MVCNINVFKFQKVNLFKSQSAKKYFFVFCCGGLVSLHPAFEIKQSL